MALKQIPNHHRHDNGKGALGLAGLSRRRLFQMAGLLSLGALAPRPARAQDPITSPPPSAPRLPGWGP